MKASLEEMRQYRHPQVIRRFVRDYPEMADSAEIIFEDLMLFFWASKNHEEEKKMNPHRADLDFIYIMDEEMKGIDLMWHIFLLYTKDYAEFCEKYFGQFLHHLPEIVDPDETENQKFNLNLERFLNYSYDLLGEEVIRRWYAPSLI